MVVMVQLGMLGFMPSTTKIGFYEDCLHIQRAGYFTQSIPRFIHSDSHRQIDNLRGIIENAIHYYRPSSNRNIQEIFSFAIKGLEQLKNTYTKLAVPNVPGNLENFINLIKINVPGVAQFEDNASSSAASSTSVATIKEFEESDIPPTIKKVIAVWTEEAYVEVLEYLRQAKELQKGCSVDVQEKATDEIGLLETFAAHKARRINYIFKRETSFQ